MLSGGGARGAYEAGLVRYLREELPRALGSHARIDILSGTSVGGLTACFLAATMDQPDLQGTELSRIWTDLTLDQVYKVAGEDLWTITRKMWRAATQDTVRPEGWRLYDLLHPTPLEEMVRHRYPWAKIEKNLEAGLFQALSVSTTQISTGKTVVFVQNKELTVPPWSRHPAIIGRAAKIGADHALASAAIPMLFRAVRLENDYYCDGSLRQNTPLSPALRLGAEKVLIVSLKYRGDHAPAKLQEYPTTPVLMGKVLNALMLDHTDYDLDRLRRTNALLEIGEQTFGPDFIPRINETMRTARGQPYRKVEDLVIRPSRDIAKIASAHAERFKVEDATASLPSKLLHRFAQRQLISEADLASYLLFDGAYARDLIALGMEDAHSHREALLRFFGEP